MENNINQLLANKNPKVRVHNKTFVINSIDEEKLKLVEKAYYLAYDPENIILTDE
jgi:hypothetical protein